MLGTACTSSHDATSRQSTPAGTSSAASTAGGRPRRRSRSRSTADARQHQPNRRPGKAKVLRPVDDVGNRLVRRRCHGKCRSAAGRSPSRRRCRARSPVPPPWSRSGSATGRHMHWISAMSSSPPRTLPGTPLVAMRQARRRRCRAWSMQARRQPAYMSSNCRAIPQPTHHEPELFHHSTSRHLRWRRQMIRENIMRNLPRAREEIGRIQRCEAMVVAGRGGGAASLLLRPASADPAPIGERTASTVTADALPTAQINGVVWSQAVVGNTVYAAGNFTEARPAGRGRRRRGLCRARQPDVLQPHDRRSGHHLRAVAERPGEGRHRVTGRITHLRRRHRSPIANGLNRYRIAAYSTATGATDHDVRADPRRDGQRDHRDEHDGLRRWRFQ